MATPTKKIATEADLLALIDRKDEEFTCDDWNGLTLYIRPMSALQIANFMSMQGEAQARVADGTDKEIAMQPAMEFLFKNSILLFNENEEKVPASDGVVQILMDKKAANIGALLDRCMIVSNLLDQSEAESSPAEK